MLKYDMKHFVVKKLTILFEISTFSQKAILFIALFLVEVYRFLSGLSTTYTVL